MSKTAAVKEVMIDPTAYVHPTAELDSGVEVGPFTVIGEGVRIGADTKISSHVVIDKWTTIGRNNTIFQFVSIGAAPQDLGYKGEKTETIIGDNNNIRVRHHSQGDDQGEARDRLRLQQPLHELRAHSP